MSYKLYKGDCLEVMKNIPNKSINLVVIDPPYNIGKAKWDKWDTVEDYVDFMGKVFKECERVLKDNGSFYFFHNDFLQIVELQNYINKNTNFIFKQLLVWDKFNGSKWNQLNAIVYSEYNRNYPKQAEYCLYYTFQDSTGSKMIDEKYIIPKNPFRKVLEKAKKETGLSTIQIAEKGGFYGKVNHGGSVSNWLKGTNIPTKEQYEKMREFLPLNKEYEKLRQEYEELRYTFNNQGLPSVLQHEPVKQNGHITPKPTGILEKIIKTSSNEGDIVLDCFMGSGSTGEACIKTKRNFIGIEKDEKYFKIAKDRLKNL